MDGVPLSAQFAALAVLLACSAFFSLAETAMMASNRHRLRHLAAHGDRGARLALDLLARTDQMLGVILLGNNLINAAAATLVSLITLELFGEDKWALGVGTLLVTFAILVFSEITPKIIGATHADRLARVLAFLLWPLLRAAYPVVWFVNLFVDALLRFLRLKPTGKDESHRLSAAELRSLVLESTVGIPPQHRTILLNLFDLERITVDDVMTPRGAMETIDLQAPLEEIRQQIATSYHTRLPVYDGDPGNIVGILHQRRLLALILDSAWDRDILREQLAEPYFIPTGTHVYSQLQFFQENRQRLGLVVDEYGEIQGLLTLEDIIEEIIGKFTTSISGATETLTWGEDGTVMVDGARSLRELNRALELDFPLDGPKTLNGLVLEHFQDIPESGISARIGGIAMEIIQTQDRAVRIVRLSRPAG